MASGLCNERCDDCKYSSIANTGTMCLYCLRVGKLRGCPAGAECTKYEKGEGSEFRNTNALFVSSVAGQEADFRTYLEKYLDEREEIRNDF